LGREEAGLNGDGEDSCDGESEMVKRDEVYEDKFEMEDRPAMPL